MILASLVFLTFIFSLMWMFVGVAVGTVQYLVNLLTGVRLLDGSFLYKPEYEEARARGEAAYNRKQLIKYERKRKRKKAWNEFKEKWDSIFFD